VDTRKIEAGDVSVKMKKKLFFFSFKMSDNVLNFYFSYSSGLEVFRHNGKNTDNSSLYPSCVEHFLITS